MKALDEIKERLAKAVVHEWRTGGDFYTVLDLETKAERLHSTVAWTAGNNKTRTETQRHRANFIAHAPTDIARLISALELAIEQRGQWMRNGLNGCSEESVQWEIDRDNVAIAKALSGGKGE